jgi:hypothetical protein
MGGGCDSPRSWERDECDTCQRHKCPSVTDYTSTDLKAALTHVLAREFRETEELKATSEKQRLKRINELEKELKTLKKDTKCDHEWQHSGGSRWCNKCDKGN